MHQYHDQPFDFHNAFPLKKGGIFLPNVWLTVLHCLENSCNLEFGLGDLGSHLAIFALVAERLRSVITAHSVDFPEGLFAVAELFGNQLKNLEVLRPFAVKVVATTSWSSRR